MGQSYRIRTTPGDDKNIVIQVNQDFEQLEILSLKVRQQDVYTRMCSDYGVVAGRVFSNRGYGIPNAKVSIFVPLAGEDEENPVITSLYPYKNLEQTNEDGYRFNLLPYYPSYPAHVPTGTFPSRLDNLTNQTVVELYDKYYKYTVTTNDSGDFLIFGVPSGTQTIVMNVDLSDIGPFSLTPQDLIRMGLATESQFDGVKFKSSPNFETLPQIIVLNKTIEVVPFWGEEDICRIGISRCDFDLTAEANLNIQPVSVFMGSIMSSNEKTGIKANGRAKKRTGELCGMFAGPGEILAITQTLFRDSDGLPILEQANLPNAGKLIDSDGTWLFDLPMNLDYVYTNEFGENVLSDDPKIGVPTKAKYRFKIKWQQSKNLNEDYKRGYYLVPNVKEKGWDINSPNTDPLSGALGAQAYYDAQSSYAFSLSWSAYTTSFVSVNNPDILSIINCEDYFYEFYYNKVYTVSQLVDQDKRRRNRKRFLGIKKINDDTCEDAANKYPVNDAFFNPTLLMFIFDILINIVFFIIFAFLPAYHVLRFIVGIVYWIVVTVLCRIAGICLAKVCPFRWIISEGKCQDAENPLKPIKLPMITYPDCEGCDCNPDTADPEGINQAASNYPISTQTYVATATEFQNTFFSFIARDGERMGNYDFNITPGINGFQVNLDEKFSGLQDYDFRPTLNILLTNQTQYQLGTTNPITNSNLLLTSHDLNFADRINKFNLKAKYYNDNGGGNQIHVKYEPTTNSQSHLDNVVVFLLVQENYIDPRLSEGSLITFENIGSSLDPNITGNTTNMYYTEATVGTYNNLTQLTINYADPNSRTGNLTKNYSLPQVSNPLSPTYSYPSDIEYFQVIKSYMLNDFLSQTKTNPEEGTLAEILKGKFYIYKKYQSVELLTTANFNELANPASVGVIVCQRGVDPYSNLYNVEIGMGKIFGFENTSDKILNTKLRINVPIQNTQTALDEMMFINNQAINNTITNNGLNLFYPSYFFTPTNYLSYNSSLVRYYSSLDSTTAPPTPTSIYSSQPLINYSNVGPYQNTQDIRTSTSNVYKYYSSTPPDNVYDGKVFFLNQSQAEGSFRRLSPDEGTVEQTNITNVFPPQSSGTLVVGEEYVITNYHNSDNFLNVGAPSNATGVKFTATATTPFGWTAGTKVSRIQTLNSFITPQGYPNRASIESGEWLLKQKAKGNGLKLGYRIYSVNQSNQLTKLNFSDNFVDLNNNIEYHQVINSLSSLVTLSKTDRILIRLVAYPNYNVGIPIPCILNHDGTGSDFPSSYLVTNFIRKDAKYDDNESIIGGTYRYGNNNNTKYYSPLYNNFNVTMSDGTKIVMRSDRLPTSDKTQSLGNDNYGVLQMNPYGSIYVLNSGLTTNINPFSFDPRYNSDVDVDYPDDNTGIDSNVLNSFSCEGMRALECYNGEGLTFTVDSGCKTERVQNGCYWFVRVPIVDLISDWVYLFEWKYRFRYNYKLCQGIIGDTFINNWINGNLYHFPFKINTFYNKKNKVKKRKYPKLLVMLQYESNNFYYRSSPYSKVGGFIGMSGGSSRGANNRNLRFPTTILNMGPKVEFLKYITLGPEFLGYYMDKLHSTSYNDLDDLVNFFVIIRISQRSFLQRLLRPENIISTMFTRSGDKIDADYAQSAAINSQFGVVPLDGDFYTTTNPNPDVIISDVGGGDYMMGVYFDSSDEDLQLRDYVSPVREIRYNPNTQTFAYDYVQTKSQVVPFYKWNLNSAPTIFGNYTNNWATSISDIGSSKYQSLDRLSSPYPSGNHGTPPNDYDLRGYIFGINDDPTVQTGGTLVSGLEYVIVDYNIGDNFIGGGAPSNATGVVFTYNGGPLVWVSGSTLMYRGQYQNFGSLQPNPALAGAPWYFYFGLTKGASALNRFFDKYVGLTLDE